MQEALPAKMEVGRHSITGQAAIAMWRSRSESVREQVGFLRCQFLQDGDLPFTDVLTAEVIAEALAVVGVWLDRIFSPLVTLSVFLDGRIRGVAAVAAETLEMPCRAGVPADGDGASMYSPSASIGLGLVRLPKSDATGSATKAKKPTLGFDPTTYALRIRPYRRCDYSGCLEL